MFYWCRVTILFLFSLSPLAQAAQVLVIEEEVRVYARERTGSKVIQWLQPGDEVPIRPSKSQEFFTVIVNYGKRRIKGYVAQRDLTLSYVESQEEVKGEGYKNSFSVGVSLAPGYWFQGKRSVQTGANDIYQVSQLSGFSSQVSVFLDAPIKHNLLFRVSLGNLSASLSGEALSKLDPAAERENISIEYGFLYAGLGLKYYRQSGNSLWYLVELGGAKAQTVDVRISSRKQDVADLPLFIVAKLGLGWDYKIHDHLYFLPEVSGGTIANANPPVVFAQAKLSGAYSFL